MAPSALDIYKKNFSPIHTIAEPIEQWINSELGEELSEEEKKFTEMIGQVDILIGGPPCQGNSDFS